MFSSQLRQLVRLTQTHCRRLHIHSVNYTSKQTHYEVLGISHNASSKEIKDAYIKKSKQFRPAADSGDQKALEEVLRINKAYDILKNQQTKRDYDRIVKGKKGFTFVHPEKEYDEDRGLKSPFIDTSREYYKHPSTYDDPVLKHEAQRVWDQHEHLKRIEKSYEVYEHETPEQKKKNKYYMIFFLFVLPIIITVAVDWWRRRPYRDMTEKEMEDKRIEELKKNMPADVYFDEPSQTFRTKKPIERDQREVLKASITGESPPRRE